MLEALVFIVLALTALFHSGTYLLMMFEKRAHALAGPARPLATAVLPWLAEGLTLLLVVITWPLGFIPGRRPTLANRCRPVVLVHGWSLNRASFAVLAARLRRDGYTVYTINYRTRGVDMDSRATEVADKLRTILDATGQDNLDVVAHSAGGVTMRAVLLYHGGADYLGNVVTLGSPHKGTALAYLSRSPDLMQIRPGSPYLERLCREDEGAEGVSFTAISTAFDAIVFNDNDSDYRHALNVSLDYIGHHVLLVSSSVYELVKENLAPPVDAEAAT